MLILIVSSGPEKGRVYELHDDQTVVIGRDGADLQFTDEKMSRLHARLWCDGGRWYVRDLGSRHGTLRNHLDIEKHLQPLKDGDAIQFGRTTLVVARMSADALAPAASTHAGVLGLLARHRGWAYGSAAAGLTLVIGLNAALLLQTQRGVNELSRSVADGTRQTLEADRQRSDQVTDLITQLDHKQQGMMPRLDTMLALLEQQPDVAGPLQALARAVEDRQDPRQLAEKLDTALAMLHDSGGQAQVMAARLTALLEQRPELTDTADALRPLLQQVLATVQTLPTAADNQQVLAAVSRVEAALPADASDTLATILARLDEQPTNTQLAHVNRQLTLLAAELQDRDDAQLIQQQLAQLLQQSADAPAAALAAADDPILGQILAQVETLAANHAKLDAILASLEQQPYQNRAMLDEVLARVDADTSQQVVAQLLDQAMAELRGKSITDADQLRRLIERQVVAAVGKAVGQPTPRDDRDESRLTRTELAYKRAFETGRKITIGVALDPTTGQRTAGRTLDPDAARAEGHRSWRDWYLMDDMAARLQLDTQLADAPPSIPQTPSDNTVGSNTTVLSIPTPATTTPPRD